MCYCPTSTLHLNLALTGDCAFLLSPQKTHTVWFISILNYGDTENVLINHLLLVIPMSYPCHYTNLCPHKPHKHAHTHTHTHTHTHNTQHTAAHSHTRTHTHTHTHTRRLQVDHEPREQIRSSGRVYSTSAWTCMCRMSFTMRQRASVLAF